MRRGNDRNGLLGGGRGAGGGGGFGQQSQSMLERQNDEGLNVLADQVSALKQITIDIGDEVREQNKMLDGMDSDFGRADGLLKGTMKKLGEISGFKSTSHMFILALFIVVVVMLVYAIYKFF